jgi:uncharacterized protein YacL
MDTSKFLAKVLGGYLIIVSNAMNVNMPQFITNVNNLINNAGLMLVSGFFTLIIGLLMVMSHNVWQWNWRVIITIFGWLALLKGASLVIYPQFLDQLSLLFISNTNAAFIGAGIDLILGLVLSYFGFKR